MHRAQGRLVLASRGDIANRNRQDRLLGQLQARNRSVNRKLGPIASAAKNFCPFAHSPRGLAGVGEFVDVLTMRCDVALGEQQIKRLPEHLGGAVIK